jgi:hypothetical protein
LFMFPRLFTALDYWKTHNFWNEKLHILWIT